MGLQYGVGRGRPRFGRTPIRELYLPSGGTSFIEGMLLLSAFPPPFSPTGGPVLGPHHVCRQALFVAQGRRMGWEGSASNSIAAPPRALPAEPRLRSRPMLGFAVRPAPGEMQGFRLFDVQRATH